MRTLQLLAVTIALAALAAAGASAHPTPAHAPRFTAATAALKDRAYEAKQMSIPLRAVSSRCHRFGRSYRCTALLCARWFPGLPATLAIGYDRVHLVAGKLEVWLGDGSITSQPCRYGASE